MTTTDNQKIKLVADITLINKDKILLTKYKDSNKYDHQKGWFLPNDMVKFDEHPSDAARRILCEQMGYITANLTLGFIESFVGNDGSWHLIFHYWQKSDALPELMPSLDINEFKWFEKYNLPADSDIAHNGWARFTIEKILSGIR